MLRGDLDGADLEQHVEERVLTDDARRRRVNWARGRTRCSPPTFGLACCAIEMMSIVAARVDVARFGFEAFRASPRQADLLIISGRVSIKMAPVVRRIYDQMLEPKWTIAMGACSSSMGVFNNYAIVPADKFMPVDVHVPGCPPRPEALMHGILKLRKAIQERPGPRLAHPLRRPRDRGGRRRGRSEAASVGVSTRQDGHECLTRPASSCSRRSCATRDAGRGARHGALPREGGADRRRRARSARSLEHLRGKGYRFLASVHGVDYFPEEPRLGVHYELLDMRDGRPHHGQDARAHRRTRACRR